MFLMGKIRIWFEYWVESVSLFGCGRVVCLVFLFVVIEGDLIVKNMKFIVVN